MRINKTLEKIENVEQQLLNVTGFVKKVHFDTKIMENNNKMSDTNNFHRKANCNTKLRKLKKKKYQMQLTLQKKN